MTQLFHLLEYREMSTAVLLDVALHRQTSTVESTRRSVVDVFVMCFSLTVSLFASTVEAYFDLNLINTPCIKYVSDIEH